ncbi:hypothetical protein [Ligilactobacillus salivarius]|uniref:hypothetical protein n=1 Tax=Ligilactobacillus salivarius TaxID=1624 RepID=UPI00136A5FF8|nr:hypothetical protein [Ligilactobacillus salivarius]MDE1525085.1 hypothetical protein [Ligilactobacillus salivarius]MYY56957.1 hypothetical protein [Ligilactobacillus salivarius]
MEFTEKLVNLMNENFNSQAQNVIAKDFQNYVERTNSFDRTNYIVLIEEVLEFGAFPTSMDVMTREAIQNCFINALQKRGVDPFEESYRTKRAKQKLERLKNELHVQTNKVFEHWEQTNGQPMNDKRNARSFFNKADRLESKAIDLNKQIKEQEERVGRLEWADERKRLGLNKQGGLMLTIDNIPRIEEELEKAERGESHFAPVTIRKYKKELARLKAEKEQLSNTSSKAQEIIESGKVNQWKKRPTIYFIKGLRKVAIELVDGSFKESPKYAAKTDEEKEIVNEILR